MKHRRTEQDTSTVAPTSEEVIAKYRSTNSYWLRRYTIYQSAELVSWHRRS